MAAPRMDDDLNRNHALDASASDASRRTETSDPGASGDQERTQAFLDDWRAATTPSTGNRRVLSLDGHPAVEIGMRTAPGGRCGSSTCTRSIPAAAAGAVRSSGS